MDNKLVAVLLMFLSSFLLMKSSMAANNFNVVSFGAKPDGRTDSTNAFLGAWQAACRSAATVTVTVPRGSFLVKAVEFRGPCRSRITFQIYGTILAPSDYRGLGNSGYWILFVKVNRISINVGTLDARGASFWACRNSGKTCPVGARSMTFNWANDVVVSGLTSINSQATHLVINSCNNVIVRKVKLVAPDQSPNTDGLHVQASTGVTVTDSTFQTGDDCISIGPGTRNLYMSKLNCGPGHGISIGSLGRDANEAGVQNITLINSFFSGSDNGVRIKTWARQSTGFVERIPTSIPKLTKKNNTEIYSGSLSNENYVHSFCCCREFTIDMYCLITNLSHSQICNLSQEQHKNRLTEQMGEKRPYKPRANQNRMGFQWVIVQYIHLIGIGLHIISTFVRNVFFRI